MNKRIIIGSANFGNRYGIKNQRNQINLDEISRIRETMLKNRILEIDSAENYGDSEEIIGNTFQKTDKIRVSTKYNFSQDVSYESIKKRIFTTKKRIKNCEISTIFVRDFEKLNKTQKVLLLENLIKLRDEKLFLKIGASVYEAQEIEEILNFPIKIEVIQIPENIVDRRLNQNEIINKARQLNIEIQARSIFLQGLLLMDSQDLSPYYGNHGLLLKNMNQISMKLQRSKYQLCVDYAIKHLNCDALIIGIDLELELREFLISMRRAKSLDLDLVPIASEDIVDPRKWR